MDCAWCVTISLVWNAGPKLLDDLFFFHDGAYTEVKPLGEVVSYLWESSSVLAILITNSEAYPYSG